MLFAEPVIGETPPLAAIEQAMPRYLQRAPIQLCLAAKDSSVQHAGPPAGIACMRYSESVKRNVQLAFEDALKALDAVGREPVEWEEVKLVKALCSMTIEQYTLAASEIKEVVDSIETRIPEPADRKPQVTKEMMRIGLNYIRIHL